MFRIDYQLEAAGNREFGSVFVNEKENVAVSLVAAGLAKVGIRQGPWCRHQWGDCCCWHRWRWLSDGAAAWLLGSVLGERPSWWRLIPCTLHPVRLQVRTPGGQQSPFYEDLTKAQADAESRSLGVWTKDKDALADAVRDVQSADGALL